MIGWLVHPFQIVPSNVRAQLFVNEIERNCCASWRKLINIRVEREKSYGNIIAKLISIFLPTYPLAMGDSKPHMICG